MLAPLSVVALASDKPIGENSSTSFISYVRSLVSKLAAKRRKRHPSEYSVALIICDRHGIPKLGFQFKFPGCNALMPEQLCGKNSNRMPPAMRGSRLICAIWHPSCLEEGFCDRDFRVFAEGRIRRKNVSASLRLLPEIGILSSHLGFVTNHKPKTDVIVEMPLRHALSLYQGKHPAHSPRTNHYGRAAQARRQREPNRPYPGGE
jgi:hypothetical protein